MVRSPVAASTTIKADWFGVSGSTRTQAVSSPPAARLSSWMRPKASSPTLPM